jgi:glycosyltransferase involved in cell wall biosynthesis
MTPSILITVLAHNEAALIADCLASLPLGEPGIEVHVVVNGSTDATAERARVAARGRATIHDYPQGGKARSWNRFTLDERTTFADVHVFVDGDATVAPGSVAIMARAMLDHDHVMAVASLPLNGRRAAAYRLSTVRDHGMFGDCYAVRGSFLERMKASGIRLPEDLIGDDGLVGALVKTDLGPESNWDNQRLHVAPDAGFYMSAPTRILSPATWPGQYQRMINYSVRYFQNRIVSAIMREGGPSGLPRHMADLYTEWLPSFRPRRSLRWWWFDRLALKRMSAAAAQDQGRRGPDPAR